MRAHYLQHVVFEGLGYMEGWLAAAGYEVGHTRLFAGEALPEPDAVDLLIIMGGPMSVNDAAEFPWLVDERAFVGSVIDAGTPVLGVCLGAQLIADVLGGRVYPNGEKEIGWFPVQSVPIDDSVFRFPPSIDVFHWHGETFDLPDGAVRLAKSVACENQAFQVGRSVIGLQFHLETTPESAEALATNCRDELVPGTYVQTEEDILAARPETYQSVNALMSELLAYLTGCS
ncbi:MAG: type 1 glutamine amidotransferase [Kiritimatiellae bacterium]|nr:type 1 glutamine amidotransferase [Kiritimatiellia bacterium]